MAHEATLIARAPVLIAHAAVLDAHDAVAIARAAVLIAHEAFLVAHEAVLLTHAAVATLVTLGGCEALSVINRGSIMAFLRRMCRPAEQGGGFHLCEGECNASDLSLECTNGPNFGCVSLKACRMTANMTIKHGCYNCCISDMSIRISARQQTVSLSDRSHSRFCSGCISRA